MRIGRLFMSVTLGDNVAGIQQLSALLHPLGYFVVPVEVRLSASQKRLLLRRR